MPQPLHERILKILLTVLLLIGFQTAQSQTFKDGIRQGIVKVKFKRELSETLTTMKISARSNALTTGMQKFDVAAKAASASNMYRLFPYDAKNESKLRKHGLHLWYVVEVNEQVDPKIAVSQFKQVSEVETAEVEHEKSIAPYQVKEYKPGPSALSLPPFNDPYLKDQWHYHNEGQNGYGNADINLFKAWESTTGKNDVIVSIHDEGVDVKHEDLKSNIWINTHEIANNGIDDDNNGYIDDINGFNFSKNKGAIDAQHHGTHVAGTIAAVNNNGKGVCGVAGGNGSGNGIKIMSLEILGGGLIERSYVYAANNGSVISQNSWGYTTEGYFDQSVADAIKYFIAEAGNYEGSPMRGGIVLFAAGNSNSDSDWYPARYEPILSVSAIGPEWKKAVYSNYGSWVEIAAPGGDQINYPGNNGVLSTIPGNKYAYMQGTSMACPHVSGIAALVLANRTTQLTSADLWNRLITGVVSIDEQNPDYIGQLGSGAIDASLAIKANANTAPQKINDLQVDGISQEFATLSWSVPADNDDSQPSSFDLYYYTSSITSENLALATKVNIKNNLTAGSSFSYEVSGLLGLTTYYFAVTSTDRWGNVSVLSNVPSAATNAGPSIAVDPASLEFEIDASVSNTGSASFNIMNNADGILRWKSFMRHRSASIAAFDVASIHYPVAPEKSASGNIARINVNPAKKLSAAKASTLSFTPSEKKLSDGPTNLIGETNTTLPNSGAGRFYVTEEEGFNLTDVSMYLKHDADTGPVVVEIYKGNAPTKQNLIYAQEYVSPVKEEIWASIVLDEQIYFEKGSTFWIAFHVPAGNLFPLGIGYEFDATSSSNCFISFNVGNTWQPLEEALNDKNFAWVMSAESYNQYLGTYLTLDPSESDLDGHAQTSATLTADASQLVNGSYDANLLLASNDANQKELRIPVHVTVTGHAPDIRHIDIADFGSVFMGEEKTLDIVLDNQGLANLSDISFNMDGNDFEIVSSPNSISAREQFILSVTFKPGSAGNKNAVLRFSNDTYAYAISLFGVGAETSKIIVTPEMQTLNDVTIGDAVTANITIENAGAYPLKYFIPGFDTKGVSDNWPSAYHKYGYKMRTNRDAESNPIAYDFTNISGTGVDITNKLVKDNIYFPLDMGFTFPYYGKNLHKIFIAQKGFTTFDDSVRPINTPQLNNGYTPAGYISPLGTFLTYIAEGKILYQLESDRLIIQYDHVTDGYSGYITAQMVLFSNGDIRFYYDDMSFPEWAQPYLNILIEDVDKADGILIHDYENPIELHSGLVIGLDYPGPNIITSVSNASGILAPGTSASLDVQLSTASLAEGIVNRYINIVSNDPLNKQKIALVKLDIAHGGTAVPVLSDNNISFGNVFKGAVQTKTFSIKNDGTAVVDVTSITLAKKAFNITGDASASIKPGLLQTWSVQIPTTKVASLSDVITIHYADGSKQTINVTGKVIPPPAISVDLSAVVANVAYGDKKSIPLIVKNTGSADLEFSTAGKSWLYYESNNTPATFTYDVQKENTGGVYQWLDIRRTGVQLPFATDISDESQYWRNVTLPFSFEYFGKTHSEIKIGENGIISFEDAPPVATFSDSIPSKVYEGAYIMPYWTFGGFDTQDFKKEDVGIFYQSYDDKVVITWSYLVNNFGGMGDPVSAQVILYNNGEIKFQYKVEGNGADLTSQITIIGLQESTSNGIMISDRLALDFGSNLAYNILPVIKYTVSPSQTLTGNIILDATHTYSGNYESALKIFTNVPGKEVLEKPVSLTITGSNELSTPDAVDFGNKIIAFENNMPVLYPLDLKIENTGTAPVDLTWIQSASGETSPFSLQLFVLVDGEFGQSREWVDVSQIFSDWVTPPPVFQIMPGDTLPARVIFFPSETGDFNETFSLTTSIGEKIISLTGTGIEAPALEISTDPIEASINTRDEIVNKSLTFNNTNGKSPLYYTLAIEYDRIFTPRASEVTSTTASGSLQQVDANVKSGISPTDAYNRTIKYTQRTTPDVHVGTGGSEPFTLATKFNAGNMGFNLSHVETWFRAETLAEGDIDVEVRAGSSITEATTLIKNTIHFTRSSEDQKGNWMQLPLDHEIFIYPNEDFYVLLTYPLEMKYPQGTVKDEPTIQGRYLYAAEGTWLDIQNEDGFLTAGWLMYAAEQNAITSSWINITSATEGTVDAGDESSIELSFEGAMASPGDQHANIVVTTNDPSHKRVFVPVNLHVNQAPQFGEIPEEIILSEKDTVAVPIAVSDLEGNSFTISSDNTLDFLTNNSDNGILNINLTPSYGEAGHYAITFTTTDEYGAVNSATLHITVEHKNQAPVYIGDVKGIAVDNSKTLHEFSITDLFKDPDNDLLNFTAVVSDSEMAEVFSSSDKFLVEGKKAGSVDLHFVVTDAHGGLTDKIVPVTINVVAGVNEQLLLKSINVFPNPADNKLNIAFDENVKGMKRVEIIDCSGRVMTTRTTSQQNLQIDVQDLSSGLYLLKALIGSKSTIKKIIIK
jgi:subtilisin family serine protease